MMLSGNRFRALVVCLAPAPVRGDRLRRRRAHAGRADAARARTPRSCPCASRSARIARRWSPCWDSAPRPPVPRPTCSAWSIRWPRPRPIRDACCATSISRTARWSLRGSSVDLEELGGVGVGLGAAGSAADGDPHRSRASTRTSPAWSAAWSARRRRNRSPRSPNTSACSRADSELPVAELAVPALPRLLAINGSAPAAGLRVDTSGGLTLSLGGRRRIARRAASVRRDRRRQLRGSDQRARPRRWSPSRARCSPTCARRRRERRERRRRCRSRSRAGSARASRSVTSGARVSVEVRSTLAVELRP